jgi:hypothetical protein
MCEECRTGICALFDGLVRGYFTEFRPELLPRPGEFDLSEKKRPKYMPADVGNAPESAATKDGFSKMADAADGIGFTRMEFLTELSNRSGYGEWIMKWAGGEIPNGIVRKIILTCAEDVLKEHGARPEMSMKLAA